MKNVERKMKNKTKAQFSISREERGQILLAAVTLSTLVMVLSVSVLTVATVGYRLTKRSHVESQALGIAEGGIDHAIRQLNLNSSYAGEVDTTFGDGTFTIDVSGTGNTRTVESTGSIPNSDNPRSQRTIRAQASINTDNVQFFYGVQVDEGGIDMGNNARVIGNVYANGSVVGGNGATVTGDAVVAGGAAPEVLTGVETQSDWKHVGRYSQEADKAQSFTSSKGTAVSKVSLYLSKQGSPGNLPVKLVTNSTSGGSNQPSKTVLASATISAASVGVTGSWIDASFSSPPTISANTRYWIILDGSANSSNYFKWGHTANVYGNGQPKYSTNWNAGNPSWTDLDGDMTFRVYGGGLTTKIDNVDVNGTAKANLLKDLSVGIDAYYQTLDNTTVGGTSYPGSPDPSRADLPISDGVIADWKNDALAGGTHSGTFTVAQNTTQSLGPKKVTGDLVIENGATLIITGTLWVAGNLDLNGNGGYIRLDPSYGTNSGIIVTDGWIHVDNNFQTLGSGVQGSYVILLTTADHSSGPFTHHNAAVDLHNGMSGSILYAGKGTVHLHNTVNVKEVTAWRLELDNEATVTYDSGLQNSSFTSGPGGGWAVIKGTWQEIK